MSGANIWLVVITFLAAVDGGLLRFASPGWVRIPVVSAAFLAASGVATIVALWPRSYDYPPEPRKVAERLEWIGSPTVQNARGRQFAPICWPWGSPASNSIGA